MDQLEPSSDDLLRIVFSNVDESMLREIAAADYGEVFDEHLEQLAVIKSGKILAPMQWEPKEVLELIRWSEPEDPSWSPGSTGDRGHWMRLFACVGRSAGMIGHHRVSRLGVSPGCTWKQPRLPRHFKCRKTPADLRSVASRSERTREPRLFYRGRFDDHSAR
ncbi:hypothetical protein RISK_005384 [Rhodopirellula islandica]|uniref:Uncharacterized protein n=1 Tax=Rhodopirellula islandica TaxID=595434 RepID=A0A0J1B6U8_RHOIS|nr:hypothetical protein RISK_005384 [Rhodopirellula islandica]